MIKKQESLTLAEVVDLAGITEKETKMKGFAKQFVKMNTETAGQVKEDIKKLDLIKLKDEHIVKIVDFMPQDSADLNKILPGVSLNQDESEKILGTVKKH